MKRYGLVGKSLSHSFSKDYFKEKFESETIEAVYENHELSEIAEILKLLGVPEIEGLNVTMPYKEVVIPFLDEIDNTAKEIGSVNTIAFQNSKTIGHNTDVTGFENSLKPFLEHGMERALILGTGGASKAVAYVLKNIGLDVLFVSRHPTAENEISYADCNANAVKWHRLIVNTTPLGTAPLIDESPEIDYNGLGSGHLLYDLVYNPSTTKFLDEGKKRGASTLNGLGMLKIQAEKSWEIWSGS